MAGVDERPASPPSMTPQPPSPDVVTQPQPRPVELRRDVEVPRQLSRHASSDEEVNFIEARRSWRLRGVAGRHAGQAAALKEGSGLRDQVKCLEEVCGT